MNPNKNSFREPTSILVIDNDESFLEDLTLNLSAEGYRVVTTQRGEEGLGLAEKANPDLILLDVLLPDVSGIDVIRRLRARANSAPIIVVTGASGETDIVVGLEVGADDYVTKPCNPRVLLARIRAQLRRRTSPPARPLRTVRFGDVEVDFEAQRVMRSGQAIEIKNTEFDVLRLLIRHRGQVVNRQMLLAAVWGYRHPPTTRTVDNQIVKLRRKLEEDPARPKHILSVYGQGYKFVARTSSGASDSELDLLPSGRTP